MIKVGEHITLDIIGTDKEYDPSVYEKVINEIAKAAKVTILNISKYKFEPQGFTILALLAESHISFHTFPEKGIISFDFFTCGKISPSIAIDIIRKEFKHKRIVKKEFNRGKGVLSYFVSPKVEFTLSCHGSGHFSFASPCSIKRVSFDFKLELFLQFTVDATVGSPSIYKKRCVMPINASTTQKMFGFCKL